MMSCRKSRPSGKPERVGALCNRHVVRPICRRQGTELWLPRFSLLARLAQIAGKAGSEESGHSSFGSDMSSVLEPVTAIEHPLLHLHCSFICCFQHPTVLAALSTPSETSLIQSIPYSQDLSSSSAFCMSAVRCHLSNVAPTRRCYQHPSNPSTTGVPIPPQQHRVVG